MLANFDPTKQIREEEAVFSTQMVQFERGMQKRARQGVKVADSSKVQERERKADQRIEEKQKRMDNTEQMKAWME